MRFTHAADGYQVSVRDGTPDVALADPDGRVWSRLSLLASLDRTDCADESYDLEPLRVAETADAVEFELRAASAAWRTKSVVLRCFTDRLELTARVSGRGTLAVASLLGGRAVLPSGAGGTFRSSIEFGSVFDPTPTEPIQVVRPPSAAATLGVLGDAAPGRLHAVFSPPPLCFVLGRSPAEGPTDVPDGDWLSLGVAGGVHALRFTELRYTAEDGGFRLELDYDGHTTVDGEFETPPLVLRPASDPWQALSDYREDLVARGAAPAGPSARPADWWREPIFCGWGAQCARAADGDAPAELSRQEHYDEWLARLAAHGVVPGTVVIDDRWQAAYGAPTPDPDRWPDLEGWIAARHAAGQRVLLWWKAWDPEGLPPDECVLTPSGDPLAADPASAGYVAHLERIVAALLGPDGLDADGFKVDFTQRSPAGRLLRRPAAGPDAAWGIALLHALLSALYRTAKAAKPDALLVTHTPHPAFADVSDMIRLNDLFERDPAGRAVPPADQLAFRHAVVARTMPGHLVDTDQWPIATRSAWRDYVRAQPGLGVPSLYFAERIDGSGEELTADDYALVAATWREYRGG